VHEYSPIGVKFPPITASRTLYTVKKKLENFPKFFVLKIECPEVILMQILVF
jgi:hypothetical protein